MRRAPARATRPGPDSTTWQYDGLSRLVGSASAKTGSPAFLQFNACRWDAAWRLAQPCGNSGQLALMGANVTRSSLFWTFVHAPGIDEALLLLDRTDNFFVNKRLQAVTDGRGQLLAIADSAGFITEAYAGSGHDQSSWQGAGLTTQAQSYNPRKWQTDDQWGGIQQFRNRAYDPATGTWIQEDPMGVAGGVNVYRFNNGNPVSFGDPFGLCPDCLLDLIAVGLGVVDIAKNGASAGRVLGLAADIAGAVVPGLPSPGGAKLAAKVVRAARGDVQANRVAGKAGEAITEATLRRQGNFAGRQVTFETSTGQRTVIDFVTKGGGVVETKVGSGRLSSGQRQLFGDIQSGRPVTPRGQNAAGAGLTPGQPTTLTGCGVVRVCP